MLMIKLMNEKYYFNACTYRGKGFVVIAVGFFKFVNGVVHALPSYIILSRNRECGCFDLLVVADLKFPAFVVLIFIFAS